MEGQQANCKHVVFKIVSAGDDDKDRLPGTIKVRRICRKCGYTDIVILGEAD